MSRSDRLDAEEDDGATAIGDRCPCGPGPRAWGEMRCDCGSLLARTVPGGVELKCRRCKRTVTLLLSGEGLARAITD